METNPAAKPLMIYDGDCGFCRHWVARWKARTGDRVDYAPYQEAAARFPEIPPDRFKKAVHLVEPDGRVSSGAEAVFRSLSYAPSGGRLLGLYRRIPFFAKASEWAYDFVAHNRFLFSPVTRALCGVSDGPPSYRISSHLFLRFLGLIYCAAFLSLGAQVLGLIGSHGILPASDFLDLVRAHAGANRYLLMPTVFWLNSGDAALRWACMIGAVVSLFAAAGVVSWPVFALLWGLYLSLTTVGQDFLWYQWDSLLLEAGFLAIWLAPTVPTARPDRGPEPFRPARWLLLWLLFRLMFLSGLAKWLSGDPTWHNLTALDFHFHTQPLPTWIAWHADHLSEGFHRFCTASVLAIEIAVPVLIFGPRRARLFACGAFAVLQICILLTGNYCFFNYLALALCLPLIDDQTYPASWRSHLSSPSPAWSWRRRLFIPVGLAILLATGTQVGAVILKARRIPRPLETLESWLEPFRIANPYGLFAVMTVTRPEIIVEGSDDGVKWQEYDFKYKPGELYQRPEFVAPHQPRLDWQMWFAALGTYRENEWFIRFCARLLQGSPPVLDLLAYNPFPGRPPRYVRAVVYEYRFTTPEERQKTRQWWMREPQGLYCPVLSLKKD